MYILNMDASSKHDTDDELLSFQSLGLAAAIVINRIRNTQTLLELAKDQQEESDRDTGRGHTEEERKEAERKYIEQRLRDIAEFERRYKRPVTEATGVDQTNAGRMLRVWRTDSKISAHDCTGKFNTAKEPKNSNASAS